MLPPLTIRLQLDRRDRQAIERQIEELIALLDEVDGDPDLEDDELYSDPLDLGEEPETRIHKLSYGVNQTAPIAYVDSERGFRERLA